MSSMNGVLSPPPIIDQVTSSMNLSSKRKREESVPNSESAVPLEMPPAEAQAFIRDLIDILKAEDTTPSILTRSIPDLPRPNGPQSKRPKPADNVDSETSILGRLSSNTYTAVDEVLDDIDAAVYEITDKLELPNAIMQNQCTAISRPPSELSIKVTAFSKWAHDLVRKGKASWEKSHISNVNETPHSHLRALAQDEFSQYNSTFRASKHALTIFGNAPLPKQLFSSLQIPTRAAGAKEEVIVPIREAGLPNGIATTQVIATHPSNMIDSRKRPQTLGEVFPTPPSVTPSIPPKPSTIATTKSTTVGWYHPASLGPVSKSLNYFNQCVTSGQWVDYSKTSSSDAGNKLKHKDRILDFGLSKRLSTDMEAFDSESERLETLFQSVYSSFAPTKDNAAAIVPTGSLDRLWWNEVGEKCFSRLCDSIRFADEEVTSASENDTKNALSIFEKGLEELQESSVDPSLDVLQGRTDKPVQEKDVEEVLNEISELLETLTSYQRIRHLSLNIASRPHGMFSALDTSSIGTPLKPSGSELATYEILKSQLCLMISRLPPYAIAKINSNKLADLNISTKIEINVNDYRGLMEEDESSTRTKTPGSLNSSISSPRAPNQSIHRGNNGGSTSNSHYSNQFSSQSRGPTSHYYNSIQNTIRTPSANIQRSPATVSTSYQAQRTSSSGSYRPSAFSTSYSHQSVRPIQQLYAPTTPQLQYSHTPPSQGFLRAPSQSFHQHTSQSVAQSVLSNRYSNQSLYQSQPQTQSPSNGGDYNRYSSVHQLSRQFSSRKGNYGPQPVTSQPQTVNIQPQTAITQPQSEKTNPQLQNTTQPEPGITQPSTIHLISVPSVSNNSQEPSLNSVG